MKNYILLYMSIGIVLFFALLNVQLPSLTGGAIITQYTTEEQEVAAYRLHDKVKDFFQIQGIQFPEGPCSLIAQQMYEDIALKSLDVSSGFANTANERIASMNFVIDRLRRYGTIDMIKGETLLSNYDVNSMISLNMESIVTVPKEDRTNFYSMDLLGNTADKFYITKGRFSTPSFDCAFVQYNGDVACDCDAHPIRGIEVAGITGIPPDKDYYQTAIDKIKQLKNQ